MIDCPDDTYSQHRCTYSEQLHGLLSHQPQVQRSKPDGLAGNEVCPWTTPGGVLFPCMWGAHLRRQQQVQRPWRAVLHGEAIPGVQSCDVYAAATAAGNRTADTAAAAAAALVRRGRAGSRCSAETRRCRSVAWTHCNSVG